MKKKIILGFIIVFCLSAAVSVCSFAKSEIINPGDALYSKNEAEIAQKLFSNMNFAPREKLKDVELLYKEGKYGEALSKYKLIWFSDFEKRTESGIFTGISGDIEPWTKNLEAADRLLNDNTVRIEDRSKIVKELVLGSPGSYNWGLEATAEKSDGDIFAEYTNMYFTGSLAGAYTTEETSDVKYLDKWLDVWLDYDMNFNKKGNVTELAAQEYVTSGFISCLKLARYNNSRFAVLNKLYKYNKEAVIERMNTVQFGYMLLMSLEKIEKVNLLITHPNQLIQGCQGAVTLYSILSDFNTAYDRMAFALERFQINMNKNFIKDGGDVEHDMKYNRNYVYQTLEILKVLEICNVEVPSYMNELLETCVPRLRMLLSARTSDMMYPNIAETYSDTPVPYSEFDGWNKTYFKDKLVDSLLATYTGGDESLYPAYTSIAFPYTGYYIMRKDWSKESQWMFFAGHKWSGGHSCDSNLAIMLFKNGERLLIDSGGNSYGSMDIGNYLIHSYAHNTVTVDDLSQGWQYIDNIDITDSAYCAQNPIDGIWHTNDRFDFVTGTYTDGYTSDTNHYRNNVPTKEVTDVIHKRAVINDKENEIAVVYDRLDSKLSHTMSVNWNYAKKFDNYGTVFADADEKSIKTTLNDGKAGIDIYNFTQNDISYEVNCGEYGDKDGQKTSGWTLPSYGVDYKPIVHVSTYFEGNCGQQGIVSLLVPKMNNENPLKYSKPICNNQGFEIEKTDGTKIICIGGQKENTKIDEAGFKLNAKFFYLVEKTDGSKWGMVYGANALSYGGRKYAFGTNNFEFKVEKGRLVYNSAMTAPTDFQWIETEEGTVPYYGENPDNRVVVRY